MDQTRQFYQTNLKPGTLYRLVEFVTLVKIERPDTFYLWQDKKVVATGNPADSYVLYVDSKLPGFVGDVFDKHRLALHRVVYGETVGWLDGRWLLVENS